MNHNIFIKVEAAEKLYRAYGEVSGHKLALPFAFDTGSTIVENLNRLALFGLNQTLPTFYAYQPVFLDIIGRWIQYTGEFEQEIKHGSSKNIAVEGSVVLLSLSKIIGVCPESSNMIEYFLQKSSIMSKLEKALPSASPEEIESILLSFFRLLNHDYHKFKKFINPNTLYLIAKSEKDINVAKYLAVLNLSIYLESSEQVKNEMIGNYVDTTRLTANFESDAIDYTFMPLIDAKRLSNFANLPSNANAYTESSGASIEVKPEHLSKLVTSIYGVLVPHLVFSTSSVHIDQLVPTETAVHTLRNLALNIQHNKPTMLYGNAGAGKTFLYNQLAKFMSYQDDIVKIHLGEQTDAKLLLGTYSSGDKPGTFKWRAGVLTTAVKEGKWVLIEDIDKAPTEVLSILLTLLEKRQLIVPSRGEVIKAHNNFQIVSTVRTTDNSTVMPDLIGSRLWSNIKVETPSMSDLVMILSSKFPLLGNMVIKFIKCFNEIIKIYSSNSFISLNKGSHPRVISSRDLVKFCSRCNMLLVNEGITEPNQLLPSSIYDNFFQEAVDCFGSAVTEHNALVPLITAIGETMEIPPSRINLFVTKHVPNFLNDELKLKVGRSLLHKSETDRALNKGKKLANNSFAKTNHSLRLMEQICVSIQMVEPVLLVGETGTGKTTVVQQVAKMMNKKLTVINVSQQTESGDLLGGFKPVNTKIIAIPLQEIFENLFTTTFSKKKNERFSQILAKCFNKNQWKNVIKLWKEAIKMSKELLTVEKPESDSDDGSNPTKKRRLKSGEQSILFDKWIEFEGKVQEFEFQSAELDNSFVFNFVEGSLVQAVKNGEWLLLDEINLASSDTLESIADLLTEVSDQRSIFLSERGDIEPVKAHPDFRIFGCMNPSTDVGKRDLPSSIRSRFSEIYVHSPDRDINDLLAIIDKYIGRYTLSDEWIGQDIAELYFEAKNLSETNRIVDGANQKPHFSIRTLTRTLIYVTDIVQIYGLRRSLYEGFCMSFLTLLDAKSEEILKPVIEKYTINKLKNPKSVMNQIPPSPSKIPDEYVQFKHYWMKHGPNEIVPQPHYIITPFVEKNMLNLVRATAGRRFPVLVQGPTSAGKTSMINYLANITGHKFVRINNHEHTDLQEYLGTYVSDSTGKLTFKEGILVEALRNGYWIVLDELNLAPTDVLEALNRLLDDNRELFIPETQQVVHPHPDFMIFATQNPPGLYGGRKVLSRAFRNRFLELHFDDIPQDELEIILKERCQIAPTYGKKIVEVYKQLTVQRQSTRLFEQKNSFATLRDLFRWALREAVGYEELAANGYMLLAERVRKPEEKQVVKETIEKVMRVTLNMDEVYAKMENEALMNVESSVVWTKAMRRLAVLVSTSIKYKEPLLLVGETGCGKTTICQIIAEFMKKSLITVNAHQNTETSDILGAQRPVRNRYETRSRLLKNLIRAFDELNIEIDLSASVEDLVKKFNAVPSHEALDQDLVSSIAEDSANIKMLFEWNDGPLIHAMKQGDFFLLDEISLADDSVLERLNSVLEPERSLLLAEKGTEDAFITAAEDFVFLATMNPGGDYGKKELSPALRNRFTEIWVPSMEDFNDVEQIVKAQLDQSVIELSKPIVEFSEFYGKKFGGGNATSGVISLRDITAWVRFINSCIGKLEPVVALLHGASMVFIDALGTNNTAYLAEDEQNLLKEKLECVGSLSQFVGQDLIQAYSSDHKINLDNEFLNAGSFSIPRVTSEDVNDFLLQAPTTSANAMRVIRAMQVSKPILLEGSPGVGKTSLVSAIAKATGNNLIRINLSEQTDLVDLFGSDTPAEGGKTGEFVWRDAPFLRAMQRGEWVLLDEMNLASQSVLEGLNACLDHRGEAYIPELDKSFSCHPSFTVFAAQNPQYQGGGRKGLPKSFVNRFTVVYVDALKEMDLNLISHHLYPNISEETCSKIIRFMSELEDQVVVKKQWGSSGGPWEFNLRDTLRWLELLNSKTFLKDLSPADFLDMSICHRFRTSEDKLKAKELFESIFGPRPDRDNFFRITTGFIQARTSLIKRNDLIHHNNGSPSLPLHCNTPYLEAAIRCVNHNLPLILTGASNSGKTELVRYLAKITGAKLNEFAMNSDVDSMDILGGYEQVDLMRDICSIIDRMKNQLSDLILNNLRMLSSDTSVLSHALDLFRYIEFTDINTSNFNEFQQFLASYVVLFSNEDLSALADEAETLASKISNDKSVKFKWFDGLLVEAVEKGYWLILDNANLCSPSVLDRLNSLLETNGSLIMNECSNADGSPRVLKPHAGFRLFLTMDPKYGELSRAMRNRGMEIHLSPLEERVSSYDRRILGYTVEKEQSVPEADNIVQQMNELQVQESGDSPVIKYGGLHTSSLLPLTQIHDSFNSDSNINEKSVSVAIASIQYNFVKDIRNWKESVVNSKEFKQAESALCSKVVDLIDFLESHNSLSSLYSIVKKVDDDVKELIGSDQLYSLSQSLHPLINGYVAPSLASDVAHLDSNEPTFFFDVVSNIIDCDVQLKSIEQRALHASINELTYIERSAAFELNRSIKKPPKLNVFRFVSSIHQFVLKVYQTISDSSIFSQANLFKQLHELQIILRSLLDASREQNEARIRAYRDLVDIWIKENKLAFGADISFLESGVESFSQELQLNTGFSMDKIWEGFRRMYPTSVNGWTLLVALIELISTFDKLAVQQTIDSLSSVTELRRSLIDLYDTVILGDIGNSEYEMIFEQLKQGIEKLNENSSSFLVPRNNAFVPEFKLLSILCESKNTLDEFSDQNDLISMGTLAAIPTTQYVYAKHERLFLPYPAILDNLFNEVSPVNVRDLFDNTLALSSISKAHEFSKTEGKLLKQKLSDIQFLAKSVINNSQATALDQVSVFASLLKSWIIEVLKANKDFLYEEVHETVDQLTKDSTLEQVRSLSDKSSDERFNNTVSNFLFPALQLVENKPTLEVLGKAFVLFACGAVQMYVPSTPYDPAIKEHVIYNKYLLHRKLSQELVDSWKSYREVENGDEITHQFDLLKQDEDQKVPLKPRVLRESPIDPLYEEWKAFAESSLNVGHVETLLDSAQDLASNFEQLVAMFQNNSARFLQRLDTNFYIFSDLNDILKGFILSMKLGLDLLNTQRKIDETPYKADLLFFSNADEISDLRTVKQKFNVFKRFSKKQKPDSQICEKIMIYFIKLGFVHGMEKSIDILQESFQALYYRWTLRKLKESEENMQSESLYKYDDPDMDIEGDFKTLFPDYEEVVDLDVSSINTKISFDDVYFDLANAYIEVFSGNHNLSLKSCTLEGNNITSILSTSGAFTRGMVSSANISSLALSVNSVTETYSSPNDTSIDFYRGSSTSESKRAMGVIEATLIFTMKLLEEWPEHATLLDIARVCNEFLNYPLSMPMARQLQKIEQIYTFIAEWEKYAHSKISLKVHFDELTTLIVSWRRFELSTWKELFAHEDKELEKTIGKWWFHLFETIVIPMYSEEELNLMSLVAALNVFISQTTYGEFGYRLKLVKAFSQHVKQIDEKSKVYNVMCNFVAFYEQFEGIIVAKIEKQKKVLEKDINEVILLASWKDVNIDALKQSARRSHNSLYKLVRKYRALLATSVAPIIEEGLSEEPIIVDLKKLPITKASTVNDTMVNSKCSAVSTWNERPKRLQNLSIVDKNMSVYIARLDGEDLPNVYEYSKELLQEMDRLRKETPDVHNDDTKKVIAALKNQKKKLLSDTLRELSRIGLKTSAKNEVHKLQSSTNYILTYSQSFRETLLEGSDSYFFRIIELLPRLRASVGQLAEDVPQVDAEKAMNSAENLIYSLIKKRSPLYKLAVSVDSFNPLLDSLLDISEMYDSKNQLLATTKFDSAKTNLLSVEHLLTFLPRLLDYSVATINACSALSIQTSSVVFNNALTKLSTLSSEFAELKKTVLSNATENFINKVNKYLRTLEGELDYWILQNPNTSFIAQVILDWLKAKKFNLMVASSTSLTELNVVEDVEKFLRTLSNNIIVSVQKVTEAVNPEITEENDDWFNLVSERLNVYLKSSHHNVIVQKVRSLCNLITQIEYNSETSEVVCALIAFTNQLLVHYHKLLSSLLTKARQDYVQTTHGGYILIKSLYTLTTKGFCSPDPPSEEKNDDNLHDGTGLGDGEGATNNSNDVEDDEDLSEQAQTENKEKDDKQDNENEDAVEIEGDMAGDLEDASDQDDDEKDDEDEGEELDEEIDDIDDLDPNAIDEKMWDEEAKEDTKEKDTDKLPEKSREDDMVANEDDEAKENNDNPQEKENEEEGDEGDDEKDVGEQEDEVRNDDNEKLEENVPEGENLDLPEDMNLDGDDEEEDGDDDEEEGPADKMDLADDDLKEDEENQNEDNQTNENDVAEDEMDEGADEENPDEEAQEDEQEGEENDQEDGGENELNEEGGEEPQSEEEELGKADQKEEESGGNNQEEEQEQAEGVDGSNNDNKEDEDVDMDAAVKQEAGEKGSGADNQVVDEKDDMGATGGATSQPAEQKQDETSQQDEAREMAKESLKELGDALKEFHRRHQEIKEATKDENEQDQSANERPDEFEHVDGENTKHDTQALGAADKDQMQSIDEDMAIDDDIQDQEPEIKKEEEDEAKAEMDTDMPEADENLETQDDDKSGDFEGKTQGIFMNDRQRIKDESGQTINNELENIEMELEQYDHEISVDEFDTAMSLDRARELWKHSESETQELASGLCEQLRLILAPTLATKLRGDYKTGKRLNMKRIIPYIASEFRKDKIWLRRTKPSKRQYQIMIAVDDSKSMSESNSTELAFHSIALVSKALTQLESGGLSIVRFGEDVKVVHPFDKPFNNQESGAKIFQHFDFKQTRTDIKQLCGKSLRIFENAKATTNNDLWQLQIIISDGVCEDHETVQALVRKARESRIMLVFVVIDGINSDESILDMSQVRYETDANGNSVLKVDKYLDSFPFEFYVIVKNIRELPAMLSLILRQYFSEAASNN